MTARTGQLGQDNWGRKIMAGLPGQDSGAGHLGQVSLDRKERTGWPEHDSKDRTV
jgi:hypothetical protein